MLKKKLKKLLSGILDGINFQQETPCSHLIYGKYPAQWNYFKSQGDKMFLSWQSSDKNPVLTLIFDTL